MSRRQRWTYAKDRIEVYLDFIGPSGMRASKRMLVDSGFEHECTIDQQTAQNLNWRAAANLQSNFGPLIGYIMQIEISVIQFKKHIPCYTNANLEIALAQEKFEGLIGLKLLKEFMYGGDSIEFFLEY